MKEAIQLITLELIHYPWVLLFGSLALGSVLGIAVGAGYRLGLGPGRSRPSRDVRADNKAHVDALYARSPALRKCPTWTSPPYPGLA